MIAPPKLKPGDTVAIVATGRKVAAEDLQYAFNIIQNWGLHVLLSPHIYSNSHSYLAGSDEERLHSIQWAIDHQDVKAIFCARGGYGTTRILDKVDFSIFKGHPKWIVGFSDVTAIHLKLSSLGYQSIHGIMPFLFSKENSNASVDSLHRVLFDETPLEIHATVSSANKKGKATGELIGGNLSLIVDAIGTSSDAETKGKILVIEEIDEYLYRFDRMIVHLKRAHKLQDLSGLIVGHLTDMKEGQLPFKESAQEIILRCTEEYSYPIAFNFPSGHENPNLAWIHGAVATLNVSKGGASLVCGRNIHV
jgi:muramoyltetrapeptide carboxypeptidase